MHIHIHAFKVVNIERKQMVGRPKGFSYFEEREKIRLHTKFWIDFVLSN